MSTLLNGGTMLSIVHRQSLSIIFPNNVVPVMPIATPISLALMAGVVDAVAGHNYHFIVGAQLVHNAHFVLR